MRTLHRTTALAAAGTAALALTLTACGRNGSGTAPAAAAPSPAQSAAGPGGGGGTGGSASATAPAPNAGAGKTGAGGSPAGATPATGSPTSAAPAGTSVPACTTKDVSITAALQGGPPYTHLVLTARNFSGRGCRLVDFPRIRFLESHRESVPAVAGSKPAVPVVVDAGTPAYAVVKLSGGGVHETNEAVTSFTVTLGGGGGEAIVKAPGPAGIAVDPAVWATGYWTPELRNGADEF
ncbi:DUF4232 domain-containing protein [Streptomyces sp. BE20]|uniref:DUF4232 domain-containing protein n=1 Tax=Streptomyces sp. BE20 TaxID=3002525 RepID=UPI002E791766|nr:DUF4232 domain-containing protein [Streptomyces sp. BE20]MEE1826251.1 DUF4232 domain-containing protein [Streptomyces sp. BE20]